VLPDIVVVSDLHLTGGAAGRTSGAFAGFLADLGRRASRRPLRLVILGDFLDLPRPLPTTGGRGGRAAFEGAVTAELERIAARHGELFGAFADLVAGGAMVDVVAGNHDIALLHGFAQRRLRRLLAAGDGIAFHPWIYHLPGTLYAEHGHQYHDVNAIPLLLQPWEADDPALLQRPLALELERCLAVPRPRSALALADRVCRLSGPALGSRRAAYRRDTLGRYAEQVGLAHGALLAIDGLSQASAWSVACRLARTRLVAPVRRAWSPGPLRRVSDRAAYLHRALPAIDGALRAAGQAVPCYVFGHTHLAEERPLGGGAARYLNTGTWSAALPAGDPASPAPGRFTFVEVSDGPGGSGPAAWLLRWNDEERRREPVAS
jgi:UDP-2,3-diacylglucosamine pyrophosphatase LpxH